MKTITIPVFDNDLNFTHNVNTKIKSKPNTKDYLKVTDVLPGLPQGYCGEFYSIVKNKKPIEVTRFYDIRQSGIKKLKGYFITLNDE